MSKLNKTQIIAAFIFGVAITIFVLHALALRSFRAQLIQNSNNIQGIIAHLNAAQEIEDSNE